MFQRVQAWSSVGAQTCGLAVQSSFSQPHELAGDAGASVGARRRKGRQGAAAQQRLGGALLMTCSMFIQNNTRHLQMSNKQTCCGG